MDIYIQDQFGNSPELIEVEEEWKGKDLYLKYFKNYIHDINVFVYNEKIILHDELLSNTELQCGSIVNIIYNAKSLALIELTKLDLKPTQECLFSDLNKTSEHLSLFIDAGIPLANSLSSMAQSSYFNRVEECAFLKSLFDVGVKPDVEDMHMLKRLKIYLVVDVLKLWKCDFRCKYIFNRGEHDVFEMYQNSSQEFKEKNIDLIATMSGRCTLIQSILAWNFEKFRFILNDFPETFISAKDEDGNNMLHHIIIRRRYQILFKLDEEIIFKLGSEKNNEGKVPKDYIDSPFDLQDIKANNIYFSEEEKRRRWWWPPWW